jgi:ubiquinone/menaquinone biosynthesis C-methylase UbiE
MLVVNAMADYIPIDYDKLSRIYDTSRVANAETTEKLLRLLHIGGNSLVLDMGCGSGNYAAVLQQMARSVIGVDISIGMIKQAQVKFPGLTFIGGDVGSLPFKSGTFDAAYAIQVLHHVKEKDTFLSEAYRVLRNGAYIAVHQCSHKQIQAFWFYHYFPKGLEADLARIPDSGEVVSMLERAGFSDIGMEICYQDEVVVHETPESYLDKNYRDSISTFAFLTRQEIEWGCEKLREDIASGAVGGFVRRSNAKVANDVGGSSIIYGQKSSSV